MYFVVARSCTGTRGSDQIWCCQLSRGVEFVSTTENSKLPFFGALSYGTMS